MTSKSEDDPAISKPGQVSWCGSVAHIEVRGLPPPEPLRAILMLVDDVPDGTTIIVHHDRHPIYLFPELAERGWSWTEIEAPTGEVRLELRPSAAADKGPGT